MAYPTIPTVAAGRVLVTTQADTTSPRTFPNLSSLTKNSGDLLLAIILNYESSLTSAIWSSWGASFTELVDIGVSSNMCAGVAYKWSTGSETGTFTVAQAGTITGHAAMILLSIPAAHGTSAPEATSALATGTTAAADPASLSPSWGSGETLWIAVAGSGETNAGGAYTGVASAPTNYSDYADTGISSDVVGGVEGAVAFRQVTAASEDVGVFGLDTSNARSAALVIAVRSSSQAVQEAIGDSLTSSSEAVTRAFAGARAPSDSLGSLAEVAVRTAAYIRREYRPGD